MGDIGDEWEDQISNGFGQMHMQDEETGECWPTNPTTQFAGQEPYTILKESSNSEDIKSHKPCQIFNPSCCKLKLMSRWKVPRECSVLGRNSSPIPLLDSEDDISSSMDYGLMGAMGVEKEKDGDSSGVIVANFPSTGKVPFFCRKRRSSCSTKEPDKKVTAGSDLGEEVERFLEGREGLQPFRLVGRLIFAVFLLLSPGYVFPLLFLIRMFCHVQRHNTCVGEDEEAATLVPRSMRFGYFRPRTFLKYSCRLCRETMKSEKMFRIHSKMAPVASMNRPLRQNSVSSAEMDQALPRQPFCDCHDRF